MWPRTYDIHHRAKPFILFFSAEGCPVNCGPAWSTEQIEADILHGPHMSSNSINARTTLRSEAHTKVQNGLSNILKNQGYNSAHTQSLPCSLHPPQEPSVSYYYLSLFMSSSKLQVSLIGEKCHGKNISSRVNVPVRLNTKMPCHSHVR